MHDLSQRRALPTSILNLMMSLGWGGDFPQYSKLEFQNDISEPDLDSEMILWRSIEATNSRSHCYLPLFRISVAVEAITFRQVLRGEILTEEKAA
jgi:hypothetical protein